MRTVLCDRLGIRHPLVQAGMAGATTPELVAAVSEAGGLGVLGAARIPPDILRQNIRAIRARTTKPFGVNFLIAKPTGSNRDVATAQRALDRLRHELGLQNGPTNVALPTSMLPQQLDVVFEERIPVLSFGLGDPTPFVGRAHDAGMCVMTMVSTVDEAVCVAEGGTDIVVAQGSEAGGHRSTFEVDDDRALPLVGTLALVPQIVDAVSVPVVAAGGIVDGRGVVAALSLGAVGAQLGTRFLLAHESSAIPAYKARLRAARETDSMVTRKLSGRPARALANRLLESDFTPLMWPLQGVAADDIYTAARERNDADRVPLYAGQCVRPLKREQSAAEIVDEIMTEVAATIARLATST